MDSKKFVEDEYQKFKEVWCSNSVDPRWKKFAIKLASEAYNKGLEDAAKNVQLTEFASEFLQDGAYDAIYKDSILDLKIK